MIKELLANELRVIAGKIESGSCNLTEEDALEIFETVANISMSKEEAAQALNMPTSTFDKQVAAGRLPKSHKRKGLVERLWYRKDIHRAIYNR